VGTPVDSQLDLLLGAFRVGRAQPDERLCAHDHLYLVPDGLKRGDDGGCSFSDPDIQLLLENILGARGDIAAHYLLTSKAMPQYQKDLYQYCYGTAIVTYSDGDYAEMRRMLELLLVQVDSKRS
jgi:hypothetical protein